MYVYIFTCKYSSPNHFTATQFYGASMLRECGSLYDFSKCTEFQGPLGHHCHFSLRGTKKREGEKEGKEGKRKKEKKGRGEGEGRKGREERQEPGKWESDEEV